VGRAPPPAAFEVDLGLATLSFRGLASNSKSKAAPSRCDGAGFEIERTSEISGNARGLSCAQDELAFSSLQARRIYLSSRILGDFETLLRCITHELGHFATQSVYEDHAERAADRIRQRARQTCQSAVQ
jgi:hypothetical protein